MLNHQPRCKTRNAKYYPEGTVLECDCLAKNKAIPPVKYCHFCTYGNWTRPMDYLSLEDLVNHNLEHQDLWARVEFSGSESCYVEVARWNNTANRWERYAFCKMMDVEIEDESADYTDDEAKGERICELINLDTRFSFIHSLPTWQEAEVTSA